MTCPICAKDSDKRYRPFCSRRCADVDFGKWINESYTIPAAEDTPDEDIDETPPLLQ